MNKRKLTTLIAIILTTAANIVMAAPASIIGFIQTNDHKLKEVKLEAVTPELMQQLIARQKERKFTKMLVRPIQFDTTETIPSSIQLGMANVPVLDQGTFGTCIIFAATALLDALYAHGDYISQTCYLQMSGFWETNDIFLLEDFKDDGILSKEYEATYGCGGLKHYPRRTDDDFELSQLPLMTNEIHSPQLEVIYKQNSEKLFSNLVINTSIYYPRHYPEDGSPLEITKQALARRHRVLLGISFEILTNDRGHGHGVGLYGNYRTGGSGNFNDSWVLSDEVQKMNNEMEQTNGQATDVQEVGHAMVVTGYDDNAVIVDEQGKNHQGVFTLRNSWGSEVGDHGDFYMSYDYVESRSRVIVSEVYQN